MQKMTTIFQKYIRVGTILALSVLCGVLVLSAQTKWSAVFVLDNEVYLQDGFEAGPERLTADGVEKSLPVWSKDGKTITFVRKSADGFLSEIVQIDRSGSLMHEVLFRKLNDDVVGMRMVEGIEWISDEQIAVFGSLNPSTVEYAIVNMKTGVVGDVYFTDGFKFSRSPNGKHFAASAMVPHFIDPESRSTHLCVNEECSFDIKSDSGNEYRRLLLAPVWDNNGERVAIVAEDAMGESIVVLRSAAKKTEETFLAPANVNLSIAWKDRELVLRGGKEVFAVPLGVSGQFRYIGQRDDDSLKLEERQDIVERLRGGGAMNVNVWCSACELRQSRNGPE